MIRSTHRAFAAAAALLFLFVALAPSYPAFAQKAGVAGPTEITIGGAVAKPLVLSDADLKKMPRTTVHVMNPHNHQAEVYDGVALETLLHQAGVPEGEQLRGTSMAMYVVVEAADNYRVTFSIAELDSGILDSEVLVADTMNGAPLGSGEGPFKLVAPHDKRPARWVRMLKSITVVQAPAQ
ncbi:MAG: molybdopterin-dependent oxidoreductase [Candidatus Acidiferrales bacterium]|jgi:DMSO/TMAO reductase YedYZ molybdopterin-dependent catalytic subunit